MSDTHVRWGKGPVRGAHGKSGGHIKFFGLTYSWVAQGDWNGSEWAEKWTYDLFGFFCFEHSNQQTRWAFGKIEIEFRRAQYRLYEAQQNRERRRWQRDRRRKARAAS